MKTRTNIRTIKAMFLALFFITLTACGGGGGGNDEAAVDPATIPLSTTLIQAAQSALDGVEDVLTGGATVFSIAEVDGLQALFDVFTDVLTGGAAVLSAVNVGTLQVAFDSFVSAITGSGNGGVITTAQILAAQDALDAQ